MYRKLRRSKRNRAAAMDEDELMTDGEEDSMSANDIVSTQQNREEEDELIETSTANAVEDLKHKRINLKNNVKDPLNDILIQASKALQQEQIQKKDNGTQDQDQSVASQPDNADDETMSQPLQVETPERHSPSAPPKKKQKIDSKEDESRLTPPMYRHENKSESLKFNESSQSQHSDNDFMDTPPQGDRWEKRRGRRRQRFTEEEKDAVIAGHAQFGTMWERIRTEYPVLNRRSGTNIKVCFMKYLQTLFFVSNKSQVSDSSFDICFY